MAAAVDIPFSLSEWSFTTGPTSFNHKQNALNASLNKTFPFFYMHPPRKAHTTTIVTPAVEHRLESFIYGKHLQFSFCETREEVKLKIYMLK